ncbi:MAG: putative ABC transporter ATP-binding protein [Syntrophorhabdaceae bacterium PtaU1.Bin034]|jgi:iron complex transport system ATP-binding protein|nr:MAG: putative ABC transporter ATP-binding protein [Syntrophorhabdaceae bacterium PtaU1.Bin034]
MELKPLISLEGVCFGYTKKEVLRGIDLTIQNGEIVTFLGPNGCGKSTLIKVMLGILRPLRGRVFYKGQDIAHLGSKYLAREIAYVPQIHKSSFPYRVLDVALMGRIPHKAFFFRYSSKDVDIAHSALERLSISHLADRAYTEISGGERQLTIIARALVQGAKTFIMDEPASGLDYGNQLRLLEQIVTLSEEGYTFIKSTHSPEHALWVADRAVMIKDGAIVADGPCHDVVTNENLFGLYNAKVDVVKVNGSLTFCVPRAMGNGRTGKADGRLETGVGRREKQKFGR